MLSPSNYAAFDKLRLTLLLILTLENYYAVMLSLSHALNFEA